jgi:hypothetical protein
MNMKRILATIASLYMLISCTEPVDVIPFTFPEKFTGEVRKAWAIRSIQFLQNGKGTQTFSLEPCVMDDLYVFYNNPERTYQVTTGATICDGQVAPGRIADSNWSFVNATATLTILMPLLADEPLPFILNEVDDAKMVIDIYFADNQSNYRFNFKPVTLE